MSHVATVAMEVKDEKALASACKRVGIAPPEFRKDYEMFDGTVVTGLSVQLKGWSYPVVFQNGQAVFDNYNGYWGDIKELNSLKQAYAIEAAKAKAKAQGFMVSEKKTQGGIQLICRRA